MYGTMHSVFRRLPPSWRTNIKGVLGSQGHAQSSFDWLTARKDATGKKRLDRALEGLTATLGPETARQIEGKVCVDFGAGYVPTDGVGLWLLGATEVHGVDYNDIAKPREIARAIRSADLGRIATLMEKLRIDDRWSARLDQMTHWASKGGQGFPPGYSYVAPVDVIASPLQLPKFDVLVSTSVLEHIPPSLMIALLGALRSRENDDATQIHRVDLRDHRDFDNDPYGFLDPTRQFDAEVDADSRGNGMTLSDWDALLADHSEWGLAVGSYESGRPHLMPSTTTLPAGHVVADCLILRSVTAASARSNV
ncbi:hypothetical protein [Mycobacterium sp. URHB0044]|uniref:hypothetical protein n=1 Tax=Mycobacterium sp. URHB0044 TaxID=1380386 RepID=UPI0012DFCFC2|nr:hypothetical protein [Mycobacterium sp. URHB0044]